MSKPHRKPLHVWMYESFFGLRTLTNKVFNPFHWANTAFEKWDHGVRDRKIDSLRRLEAMVSTVKGLTSQIQTHYFEHETNAAMAFMGRQRRIETQQPRTEDNADALKKFGVEDAQRLNLEESTTYWEIASLRNQLLAEARGLLGLEMRHADYKEITAVHRKIDEGRAQLNYLLNEHKGILYKGAAEYEALRSFYGLPGTRERDYTGRGS